MVRGINPNPLPAGSFHSTSSSNHVQSFTGVPVAALPAGIYNFGFRFTNESNLAVNFGYVTRQINPTPATNAVTILGWAYETSAAAGLTVTPIPEPSTALLLAGGILAVAALRRRMMPAHPD